MPWILLPMDQRLGAVDPTTNGPADRCHGSYNDVLHSKMFYHWFFQHWDVWISQALLLPLRSGDSKRGRACTPTLSKQGRKYHYD
jgi:hypothetical protein